MVSASICTTARRLVTVGHISGLIAVTGCPVQGSAPSPKVAFADAPQVGRWADPVGGAAGSGPSLPVGVAGRDAMGPLPVGGTSGRGGMSTVGPMTGGAAGRSGSAGVGGRAGVSGQGGAAGASTGVGGSSAGSGGKFTFAVLTHSQGGRFAPRNVGAIWIEDGNGKFVKTLAVWAATRARYLTKFNAEASGNRVDAVTSATLQGHNTHSVTWNLTTASGGTAPDGAYKVLVELTDYDGTGQWTSVDFMLNGMPMTLMPPDQQYYTNMQLTVQ